MRKTGVYIHIPFCMKKCKYCDFNSYDHKFCLIDLYVSSLIKEIDLYSKKINNLSIDSVFIGGGTPTILDEKNIYKLMDSLFKRFTVDKNAEITIESNPSSLTNTKLKKYNNIGINRLSIGLQSCIDKELIALGRLHNYNEFKKAYENAREAGFKNINIDLMFSIPNQTLISWENTLDRIIRLSPEHISCYSLILEEETRLFCEYEQGLYKKNSDILDRKLYETAVRILADNRYKQYEISNFAKENFECRHNIKYWNCDNYLGFGAGAHSYIGNVRSFNYSLPEKYIHLMDKNILPVEKETLLTMEDKESEYIMLHFRMVEGISLADYKLKFYKDFIEEYREVINKYAQLGLIQVKHNSCRLTLEGFHVSNTILADFI